MKENILNNKILFRIEYKDWNITYINRIEEEYDNYLGKLKIKGEYLKGERNGKGKEYDKMSRLIFEGVYLKDKKWEGKVYDILGNIVYELKKGKGLIKEYDGNGKLKFEGEYSNEERRINCIIFWFLS